MVKQDNNSLDLVVGRVNQSGQEGGGDSVCQMGESR